MIPEDIERSLGYINQQRHKTTEAESNFERILNELSVAYIHQQGFWLPNAKRIYGLHIADFYLLFANTIVEIDGGYHYKIVKRWINGQKQDVKVLNKKSQDKKDDFIYNGFKYENIKNEDVEGCREDVKKLSENVKGMGRTMIYKKGIYVVQ